MSAYNNDRVVSKLIKILEGKVSTKQLQELCEMIDEESLMRSKRISHDLIEYMETTILKLKSYVEEEAC